MHIVVVESSRTMIRILSSMLEDGGDRVTAFTDGLQAFEFIESDPSVAVVMTGLEIETMSGLELCWGARLLAQEGRAIYVIAMSSSEEQGKLIEVLDSGADEFVQKPPVERELKARLRAARRQLSMQRQLIELANIDPLTGLLNRRAFFREGELLAADTDKHPFAAIMFDIDHFKAVNDTYGHDVGDEVLRRIASLAKDEEYISGRLGGEEFAILLPKHDECAATRRAEELRRKIESNRFTAEECVIRVTSSFGVCLGQPGRLLEDIIKNADTALYEAKHTGRNRIVRNSDLRRGDARGSIAEKSSGEPTPA